MSISPRCHTERKQANNTSLANNNNDNNDTNSPSMSPNVNSSPNSARVGSMFSTEEYSPPSILSYSTSPPRLSPEGRGGKETRPSGSFVALGDASNTVT